MDHKVITEHKNKIADIEAYIADLKQSKESLVKSLNNTKNDAKNFLKNQEISFKTKGIDNEIERAQSELSDLLSSKDLFDKIEKQLIDFRKAHVQDSKDINSQIVAKVDEIKALKFELRKLANSLTSEMNKQLIDFRKAHVQDSKDINSQIVAKVDEIKALKFELRKLANSLTSEMNKLINESSEYLPETIKTNLGEFNSHRILSNIAIGAQSIGGYNHPLIETVNVSELLKN